MSKDKLSSRFRRGEVLKADDLKALARMAGRPIQGPGVFDTTEGTYIRNLAPKAQAGEFQVYVQGYAGSNAQQFLCYNIDANGDPITQNDEGEDIDPFTVRAYSIPPINGTDYGEHDLRECFPNFQPGSLLPVKLRTMFINPIDKIVTGLFAVDTFMVAGAPLLVDDDGI